MSRDRTLRTTFDKIAAGYQDARPDYLDTLFDDLLDIAGLTAPARLCEVGCGPGKATLPLARRGFDITGIELGAGLAEQARINLADYPAVSVVTSSLEEWQPPAGTAFDLVYAATSWHWVDPEIRYRKAADLLRPGGHLAVWGASHAFPEDADPFFTDIQAVYEEIGQARGVTWPPPPPEKAGDLAADFEGSHLFEAIEVRRYVWSLTYTADTYIALLDTFSDHIAMERTKRARLDAEIRRLLDNRPDGRVKRHWISVLTVGRKKA